MARAQSLRTKTSLANQPLGPLAPRPLSSPLSPSTGSPRQHVCKLEITDGCCGPRRSSEHFIPISTGNRVARQLLLQCLQKWVPIPLLVAGAIASHDRAVTKFWAQTGDSTGVGLTLRSQGCRPSSSCSASDWLWHLAKFISKTGITTTYITGML